MEERNQGKSNTRLRDQRKRRKWSRKDLAEKIGASESSIIRWEEGDLPKHYYREKLCDLFNMNEEELGFSAESQTNSSLEQERPSLHDASSEMHRENHSRSSTGKNQEAEKKRSNFTVWTVSLLLLCLVVIGGGIFSLLSILHPSYSKPGGGWIEPKGQITGTLIHFAAYAYPTHNGDPLIDHVNFTVYWQGVDPRTWVIACIARKPVRRDVYTCDADLRMLGAHPGEITVSFDVYDQQGNYNNAPNGTHTVTYSP